MEEYLKIKDGIELCYSKNIPKSPKAIILIVHGFAEHMRRYDYVVDKFVENNYGVYRFDLRAHGKSRSPQGHIEKFHDFVSDTDQMVDLITKENRDMSIFILGHSMGGLITALYGIEYPQKIKGQIFSGAALNSLPSTQGFKGNLIKVGASILPKVQIKNPINEDLCTVKQVYIDYINDPLILKKASFNFYYEFLINGIEKLQNNIKKYNLPCLLTHGEDDNISPCRNSIDFYNNISSEDKEYKVYTGLYHEILNELDKDIILQDMIFWLDKRV